jgi:hypothetical protein
MGHKDENVGVLDLWRNEESNIPSFHYSPVNPLCIRGWFYAKG